MKKTLTILATAVIAFLLLAKPVLAAVRCETQYGGGEVCVRTGELQIDKEVWDPEDEERELEVKVVSVDRFPNDKSIICEVNTAETWADDEKDKDTAQVCFEKKVLGVSELPPTGPENWLIIIPFSLLAGLVGFYLKKFSN